MPFGCYNYDQTQVFTQTYYCNQYSYYYYYNDCSYSYSTQYYTCPEGGTTYFYNQVNSGYDYAYRTQTTVETTGACCNLGLARFYFSLLIVVPALVVLALTGITVWKARKNKLLAIQIETQVSDKSQAILFEQSYDYQPLVNKSNPAEKRMTGFFTIVRKSLQPTSGVSTSAPSSIIPKAQAPQVLINESNAQTDAFASESQTQYGIN